MYTVDNGAILEAVVSYQFAAQQCLNVSHWKFGTDAGAVDGVAAINEFDGLFNAGLGYVRKLANCMHVNAIIQQVSYQWIFPTRYAYRTKAPTVGVGQIAGAALPPNVALALERFNDNTTRHDRGEMHIGAVPGIFVDNGSVTGAAQLNFDELITKATSVIVGFGTTYTPILFNRAAPAQSKVVLAGRLRQTSRVLRRRTVGVGI